MSFDPLRQPREVRQRIYESMLLPSWRADSPDALRKEQQARKIAIRRRLSLYWTLPLAVVLLLAYLFGSPEIRQYASTFGWQIDALIGSIVVAVVMWKQKANTK